MALRWPGKQRWQDYPRQALKRLPISNCSGKKKKTRGEYSKIKATLAQCREEVQRGHWVGIKGTAWVEVCRRKMWPTRSHGRQPPVWDISECTVRCKLIACLGEAVLWHSTAFLKIPKWNRMSHTTKGYGSRILRKLQINIMSGQQNRMPITSKV